VNEAPEGENFSQGTFSLQTEGKFLVTKFEFRGSFGMTLEGDCHELEVSLNFKLLINFDMRLEGVFHEL
jgi:hypothetical protein